MIWAKSSRAWAAWRRVKRSGSRSLGMHPSLTRTWLVIDQLPSAPSRKAPGGFGARIVSGVLSGAAIGAPVGWLIVGGIAGIVGAVIGTLGDERQEGKNPRRPGETQKGKRATTQRQPAQMRGPADRRWCREGTQACDRADQKC